MSVATEAKIHDDYEMDSEGKEGPRAVLIQKKKKEILQPTSRQR